MVQVNQIDGFIVLCQKGNHAVRPLILDDQQLLPVLDVGSYNLQRSRFSQIKLIGIFGLQGIGIIERITFFFEPSCSVVVTVQVSGLLLFSQTSIKSGMTAFACVA